MISRCPPEWLHLKWHFARPGLAQRYLQTFGGGVGSGQGGSTGHIENPLRRLPKDELVAKLDYGHYQI